MSITPVVLLFCSDVSTLCMNAKVSFESKNRVTIDSSDYILDSLCVDECQLISILKKPENKYCEKLGEFRKSMPQTFRRVLLILPKCAFAELPMKQTLSQVSSHIQNKINPIL